MLVEVQKLSKSFRPDFFRPRKKVLREVSFSLAQGESTGFIGVNGSGKTTTLKCLLGFIHPDSGTITRPAEVGYLPERPYYYEFLSAHEFLEFHWKISGGGAGFEEQKQRVLARVGLESTQEKRLRHFSKGMLQRIGLAQALLRAPSLLILDEPMSGLDPDGRLLVKEILAEEKKRGTTLFFSSHLLSDMEDLCDRLIVIESGQLIFQGDQSQLRQTESLEKSFAALRAKHLQSLRDER